MLLKNCLTGEIFPDCFKFWKVIPIFKKRDTDLMENYCPISVIATFSKIIKFNKPHSFCF